MSTRLKAVLFYVLLLFFQLYYDIRQRTAPTGGFGLKTHYKTGLKEDLNLNSENTNQGLNLD